MVSSNITNRASNFNLRPYFYERAVKRVLLDEGHNSSLTLRMGIEVIDASTPLRSAQHETLCHGGGSEETDS